MERAYFLLRSSPKSLPSILPRDEKSLLPLPVHQKRKIRVRELLGHCLYRRVILWTVAVLFMICLTLSSTGARFRGDSLRGLVEAEKDANNAADDKKDESRVEFVVPAASKQNGAQDLSENMPHWLRFRQ